MAAITAEQAGDVDLVRFLDLIAFSEGTSSSPVTKDDGYDVIVSGVDGHHRMTDYDTHPFATGRPAIVVRHVPLLTSTASGRYQLLLKFYRAYSAMLNLHDFSPLTQDLIALKQIKERHAYDHIMNGRIKEAIADCSNIWASFPGNNYGQSPHKIEALLEHWNASFRDRREV